MKHRALRRPPGNGFLSLIPQAAQFDFSTLVKDVTRLAHLAGGDARAARDHALRAVWWHEHGCCQKEAESRACSDVNHRACARELVELCDAMRRLLRWAALDWRPTMDVVGSGLSQPELACLTSMMGLDPFELEVDGDACRG